MNQDQIIAALGIELPIWHKARLTWNDLLENNSAVGKRYAQIFLNPYRGRFVQFNSQAKANLGTLKK